MDKTFYAKKKLLGLTVRLTLSLRELSRNNRVSVTSQNSSVKREPHTFDDSLTTKTDG